MPDDTKIPFRSRLLARNALRHELPRRFADALPPTAGERLYATQFRLRWGFDPPPRWSDWSGYERLLIVAEAKGLAAVPGDVVEIGVFLGGGTRKLCEWFSRKAPEKKIVAVDIFDPSFDLTKCSEGTTMAGLYDSALAGRDQRSVFDEQTSGCSNLEVITGDSAAIDLPCGEAPEGPTRSPVGIGATVIRAKELSERGVRCAVKAGHTYAKLAGAKGPDLRFTGRVGKRTAIFGDSARGPRLKLAARATGPGILQLVRNGVVVPSGSRSLKRTVTQSGRYGLRLVRGQVAEAVGTPIWFTRASRGRVTSRGC